MKKLSFLVVVAFVVMLSSCYQAPERGKAKFTILNSSNFRVDGANIQLTGPTGSYINVGGVTDFNGEWIYEHDPALEVILDVYAWKNDATGLHETHGIIRITPDKTENETFILYP